MLPSDFVRCTLAAPLLMHFYPNDLIIITFFPFAMNGAHRLRNLHSMHSLSFSCLVCSYFFFSVFLHLFSNRFPLYSRNENEMHAKLRRWKCMLASCFQQYTFNRYIHFRRSYASTSLHRNDFFPHARNVYSNDGCCAATAEKHIFFLFCVKTKTKIEM